MCCECSHISNFNYFRFAIIHGANNTMISLLLLCMFESLATQCQAIGRLGMPTCTVSLVILRRQMKSARKRYTTGSDNDSGRIRWATDTWWMRTFHLWTHSTPSRERLLWNPTHKHNAPVSWPLRIPEGWRIQSSRRCWDDRRSTRCGTGCYARSARWTRNRGSMTPKRFFSTSLGCEHQTCSPEHLVSSKLRWYYNSTVIVYYYSEK